MEHGLDSADPSGDAEGVDRCCALCGRQGVKTTRHHLVPRSRSRKRRRAKQWKRRLRDAGGDLNEFAARTVPLCRPCHATVHAVLSEKELEQDYHTLDRLRTHPEIERFLGFIRKQSADCSVVVRRPATRRGASRRGRGD